MNADDQKNRRIGITLRTALLSWLVTIVTLLIFITVIIPEQKRAFLENLNSKALGIVVLLRDVSLGAGGSQNSNSVANLCTILVKGDTAIDYLMITRNDGDSRVYQRSGSTHEPRMSESWRPAARSPFNGIEVVPYFNRRMFHYSEPIDHAGRGWGWIHVGLSLDSYDRSVAAVYERTGILAVLCIALSLAVSLVYAARLVRPILSLQTVVREVADGNLSARARIHSGDEVESLARSFNTMTDTLLQRDRILESVRFAAQRFLSTISWKEVIDDVLAKVGQDARGSRVYVVENRADAPGILLAYRCHEWVAAGISAQLGNPALQGYRWYGAGFDPWADQLKEGEIVSGCVRELAKAQRDLLEPQGIKTLILIPVMVDNCWWGHLGLDECAQERQWTDAERSSLRAAADMLGVAIARQRTQDVLMKAKEDAEAASWAKSQFLANMSHEIRTPITGVIGMLQLLHRTKLDKKQDRYLTNALSSAETLLTVIGDVLDFSKIEAGKMELKEQSFSVLDVVDSTLRLFAEKAEEKGIELAFQVCNSVPDELIGDPNRFRQILVNLVGNAVKFTERGEIVIKLTAQYPLSAERLAKPAENQPVQVIYKHPDTADEMTILRIEVRDSGCGIAPEHQALVFDAFLQADSSMARAHGGTGLGLAISRQLCELMGGKIGVESTLGQGSTFWFTIRLKNAKPTRRTATTRLRNLKGLPILVVDDCAVVRELIRDCILSWKGEPAEAADAASGLQQLRLAAASGQPYAVALLDWKMPGQDGMALARIIQQEAELKHTRLVLMSSFVQTSEGNEAAGFAAFVPKPVRNSDLYDALVTAANSPLTPAAVRPIPEKESRQVARFETGSQVIVVAEDNEINRDFASEIIAELGYQCQCVRSGREVVETVKKGVADLVLMDCQMPEMDGYEAARTIRLWEKKGSDHPESRHIPIVALTAHAMKGDKERCLAAGMDDYLTKPLDPDVLVKTLEKWLDRQHPLAGRNGAGVDLDVWNEKPASEIDYKNLLRRCLGKPELANRMVNQFVEQAQRHVQELETAVHHRDAEKIVATAHCLKGAAANLSAETMRLSAARLEMAGRDQNLAEVRVLTRELQQHVNHLRANQSPQ